MVKTVRIDEVVAIVEDRAKRYEYPHSLAREIMRSLNSLSGDCGCQMIDMIAPNELVCLNCGKTTVLSDRWISVEEPPDPKQTVIAYKKLSMGYRVGEATFFGGQVWNWADDASGRVPDKWQPLPAPPEDT